MEPLQGSRERLSCLAQLPPLVSVKGMGAWAWEMTYETFGNGAMKDDRYIQQSHPRVDSQPRRLARSERLPRACNALESS